MIEITIDAGDLGQTLDRLTAALENRETLHLVAARSVEELWKEHLAENHGAAEKEENPGVGYWSKKVPQSMEHRATAESGLVSVEQEFVGDYYHGVTWTPGKSISSYTGLPTRALAKPTTRVPVVDDERVAPAHAGLLAFIPARGGNLVGYLFEGKEAGTISRGKNKGKPRIVRSGPLMYTLLSSETVPPDPGIIPPDDELAAAARSAMLDSITGFEG